MRGREGCALVDLTAPDGGGGLPEYVPMQQAECLIQERAAEGSLTEGMSAAGVRYGRDVASGACCVRDAGEGSNIVEGTATEAPAIEGIPATGACNTKVSR